MYWPASGFARSTDSRTHSARSRVSKWAISLGVRRRPAGESKCGSEFQPKLSLPRLADRGSREHPVPGARCGKTGVGGSSSRTATETVQTASHLFQFGGLVYQRSTSDALEPSRNEPSRNVNRETQKRMFGVRPLPARNVVRSGFKIGLCILGIETQPGVRLLDRFAAAPSDRKS